jgi:hypothetical protein
MAWITRVSGTGLQWRRGMGEEDPAGRVAVTFSGLARTLGRAIVDSAI